MFDFGNVYSLLAQDTRLQPWLKILPQQLSDWQEQSHGDMDRWLRALKKIPDFKPDNIDLKDSVSVSNSEALPLGEQKKLESLLKMFHRGAKALITCTAFILTRNGVQTGNGTACCHTSHL